MSDQLQMRDSTAYIDDASRLSEILQEDGYLFLHRLVDPTRIQKVKQDIMAILREHHIIEDDGAADPMWSGGPHPTEAEYMAFYDKIVRLDSFKRLAESPEIITLMEGLLGGPIQVWEQRLIRVLYPDPDTSAPIGLGAHQDGHTKFGYNARTFYGCWISLMEIDERVGGLAVAPGSHKGGILDHEGTLGSSAEAAKKQGLGLSVSDLTWASTEYLPGDAVIFTNLTIHCGLPNRSDRIRLSCDYRYQRAGDSASWLVHTLGPDVRRVAQQLDETIASRALFVTTRATSEILEEVRWRMLIEKSTSLERAQELVTEIED